MFENINPLIMSLLWISFL